MSEEAQAPAAAPSALAGIAEKIGMSIPEPAAEPKRNAVQAISDRMKGLRAARTGAAEEPNDAPAAEAAPEAPKVEAPKAEEPKKEPEDKLRSARTLAELTKTKKEALELKAKYETVEKDYGSIKELASKNPIKAMEKLSGKSFKDIMSEAAKGSYDVKDVDPEVSAELAEIRKWRAEQENERKESATKAQRAADTNLVSTFLTENAAEFPVFSSMEWAVDSLLERAYEVLQETGEQPSLAELARDTEEKALSGLEKVLKNEKITSHPRIRALLGKPASPAPSAGKATLSNANAGEAPPPVEKKPVYSDEITPEQIAGFQRWKKAFGR